MSFSSRKRSHTPFQYEVADYLQASGFAVGSMTYHDCLLSDMQELLKVRDTPTAEYVRNAADMIAVHRTLPVEFLVEVKTHRSNRYHDLTAEARQFCQRLREADAGGLCLFVYHDPGVRDVGFWLHQCPPVREVRIPDRWDGDTVARYIREAEAMLPGVPVLLTRSTAGSDTPFVVIAEDELRGLPDWQSQVAEVVHQAAVCVGTVEEAQVA